MAARFMVYGMKPLFWRVEYAGFLPVALQQSVNNKPVALGEYNENLVVFFEDSAQIWAVDPDPELHKLVSTVPIGTRYAYSHTSMATQTWVSHYYPTS